MLANDVHENLRNQAVVCRCRAKLYGQAPSGPAILVTFPPNLYSDPMSHQNEVDHTDSPSELRLRIRQLEAELDVARHAAATAEREQGGLQGELTKTTELWAAACHAREQWDVLFSENVEELRLANERLTAAVSARSEIEQSTSWRLIQLVLTPYRRLRGLR